MEKLRENQKKKKKAWCEGTTTLPFILATCSDNWKKELSALHVCIFFFLNPSMGMGPILMELLVYLPVLHFALSAKMDKKLIVLNDCVNDDVWMKYCLFVNNNNRSIFFIWGFFKHDIIWLVFKLEISYNRVIIMSWRILVSFF